MVVERPLSNTLTDLQFRGIVHEKAALDQFELRVLSVKWSPGEDVFSDQQLPTGGLSRDSLHHEKFGAKGLLSQAQSRQLDLFRSLN